MSKLLAQRMGKRTIIVTTLRHNQRLFATLAESKDVALGLAKDYNAESSKLWAMATTSHVAKSPGYMGNPSGPSPHAGLKPSFISGFNQEKSSLLASVVTAPWLIVMPTQPLRGSVVKLFSHQFLRLKGSAGSGWS
ncbi:hypothetical protein BHE74_00009327 [Ensete ventricosum]|nr:hypothetical protein BHE74_00009327 [Ensete ventricosum]